MNTIEFYWDNLLGCLSSIPDMLDACGVQCATSQVLAVLMFPLFEHHIIDCATPMVVWLLGMCE